MYTSNRLTTIIGCLLLQVAVMSCSTIDDNLDDCETDYNINYELRLVTNMTTELQTELSMEADVQLAANLQRHLKNIFTDHAHDVDLSFYDITGDSLRLHHFEHIMDANQQSYTLYIPRQKYMHLAVANVVDNPLVELREDERCHKAVLGRDETINAQQDTLDSHTTGLFTARQPMEMVEDIDQTFNVHLYMANCAAALVIDPRGQNTEGLQVFTTGFATAFSVADSSYSYSDRPHIIRTASVATGTDQLCFCSVTFPSPEPTTAESRSVIETIEPFVARPSEQGLWQIKVYIPQSDGSVTESLLSIREPLRAGQLKIVKCWLGDNGAVVTNDQTVGVSVTLNWQSGGDHQVDL